jgi:hypothetical protein
MLKHTCTFPGRLLVTPPTMINDLSDVARTQLSGHRISAYEQRSAVRKLMQLFLHEASSVRGSLLTASEKLSARQLSPTCELDS